MDLILVDITHDVNTENMKRRRINMMWAEHSECVYLSTKLYRTRIHASPSRAVCGGNNAQEIARVRFSVH